MALNVPGLVAVVLFYLLVLGTGVWAARKSRRAERKCSGDQTEVVLLGDRNISLVVGIFTMTGQSVCTFFRNQKESHTLHHKYYTHYIINVCLMSLV